MQALFVVQPAAPQTAPSLSPPGQNSSAVFSLAPLPSIFDMILKGKGSASQESPQQSGMAGSDADLLESAMNVASCPEERREDQEETSRSERQEEKKAGLKGASKQNSAKSVKTKTDKKEVCAQPANATQVAEYKIDTYPTDRDSYRNLYVSKHHNKAKTLALKCGLSLEQAKAKGRQASAEASQMWNEYHSRDD